VNNYQIKDIDIFQNNIVISTRDGIVSIMNHTIKGYENNTFITHMFDPKFLDIYKLNYKKILNQENDILNEIEYVTCIKILILNEITLLIFGESSGNVRIYD